MREFMVYQASDWSKRTDYDFDVPRHSQHVSLAELEGREDLYKLSVEHPCTFILEMDYRQVATITAQDLNEVYRVGNGMGNDSQIDNKIDMWSISIGDLIKDIEKNELYIVEPAHFRLLGEK